MDEYTNFNTSAPHLCANEDMYFKQERRKFINSYKVNY